MFHYTCFSLLWEGGWNRAEVSWSWLQLPPLHQSVRKPLISPPRRKGGTRDVATSLSDLCCLQSLLFKDSKELEVSNKARNLFWLYCILWSWKIDIPKGKDLDVIANLWICDSGQQGCSGPLDITRVFLLLCKGNDLPSWVLHTIIIRVLLPSLWN